jgi:predicted N-formylglutamate amidohydrolase
MQAMSREGEASPSDLLPFELINPEGDSGFLIVCDHASNALPEGYGTLGLAPSEFERHIAYDIGAAGVSRLLAEHLGASAVLARYSRLLVDLNRGADDPTLVMKLSEGAIIPANRDVDPFGNAIEFEHRLRHFYLPYHEAIEAEIARSRRRGVEPAIVSVHSFTPAWRGAARPWHVGILWDRDDRLPDYLLRSMKLEPGLVVGDNEPYSGRLKGDCLYQHGTMHGLAHALIEIRQDLIADEAGQREWAARIAALLRDAKDIPALHEVRRYGSHADGRAPI